MCYCTSKIGKKEGIHYICWKRGTIIFAFIMDDKTCTAESKKQIPQNSWHHVACVKSKNSIGIVIDAAEDTMTKADNVFNVVFEGAIRIGAVLEKPSLSGYLSDTRFVTRALTSDEIVPIVANGRPPIERHDEYPYQLLSLLRSVSSTSVFSQGNIILNRQHPHHYS